MMNADNIEVLREEKFIECIYGIKSRVSAEDWIHKVGCEEQCAWALNASELRRMVLELASTVKRF